MSSEGESDSGPLRFPSLDSDSFTSIGSSSTEASSQVPGTRHVSGPLSDVTRVVVSGPPYNLHFLDCRSWEISPLHGVPLHATCHDFLLTVVCKTPRGTLTELECCSLEDDKGEGGGGSGNPVKPSGDPSGIHGGNHGGNPGTSATWQGARSQGELEGVIGKRRGCGRGGFRTRQNLEGNASEFASEAPFNMGMLPQTWANPELPNLEYGGIPYDGRPMEVVEIGTKTAKIGEIYAVRVVGAFAVIEFQKTIKEAELSWKVVAIRADEGGEGAKGEVDRVREWLRICRCVRGGGLPNVFGLNERLASRDDALKVVQEAHASWQLLVNRFPRLLIRSPLQANEIASHPRSPKPVRTLSPDNPFDFGNRAAQILPPVPRDSGRRDRNVSSERYQNSGGDDWVLQGREFEVRGDNGVKGVYGNWAENGDSRVFSRHLDSSYGRENFRVLPVQQQQPMDFYSGRNENFQQTDDREVLYIGGKLKSINVSRPSPAGSDVLLNPSPFEKPSVSPHYINTNNHQKSPTFTSQSSAAIPDHTYVQKEILVRPKVRHWPLDKLTINVGNSANTGTGTEFDMGRGIGFPACDRENYEISSNGLLTPRARALRNTYYNDPKTEASRDKKPPRSKSPLPQNLQNYPRETPKGSPKNVEKRYTSPMRSPIGRQQILDPEQQAKYQAPFSGLTSPRHRPNRTLGQYGITNSVASSTSSTESGSSTGSRRNKSGQESSGSSDEKSGLRINFSRESSGSWDEREGYSSSDDYFSTNQSRHSVRDQQCPVRDRSQDRIRDRSEDRHIGSIGSLTQLISPTSRQPPISPRYTTPPRTPKTPKMEVLTELPRQVKDISLQLDASEYLHAKFNSRLADTQVLLARFRAHASTLDD